MRDFDLALDLRGDAFQQRVWAALREIPHGEPPATSVQPGKSTTYSLAFGSPSPSGDLQIDVRPGFVLNPATFTGRL